ncbi:MAG: hypothetical protein H0U95_15240 [Bacteroidetes bacterium]|nr:hypothetical protein [Bacteroidota bacterium]
MKKLLAALFIASTAVIIAQPKGKDPKMAATLSPGYYCNLKGDTIKGEIQSNPTNGEPELYRGFNFKPKGNGKLVAISNKKAKCYGFDGRHFTLIPFDADFVYIEYLSKGRLNFMEYKYAGSVAGQPGIESIFFIQDTKADEASKELRELKQISTKFYKKDVKPYMKDQIATWDNLDKFTFRKEALINAINEFNTYYPSSSSAGKNDVEIEKVGDQPKEETE